MKAAAWIDRVKSSRGWESDYRASKELGLSRSVVSGYRAGKYTMDDEAAIKVAEALGQPPEIVLLDQAAERTKSPQAASVLRDALRRLGGVAAGILLAAGLGGFPNGNNGLGAQAAVHDDIHRIKQTKRKKKPKPNTWHPQFAMA